MTTTLSHNFPTNGAPVLTAIDKRNTNITPLRNEKSNLLNISQQPQGAVPGPGLGSSQLPAQCSWFNPTTIHEVEKRALQEFFNGTSTTKTPETYKQYRDFMILTYKQNPNQYLTQTACRRGLAGDVCAIMRVHSFLEHWGLINFQVNPSIFPMPTPSSFLENLEPIQSVYHFNDSNTPPQNSNLSLRRNVYPSVPSSTPDQDVYKTNIIVCNNCKKDCTRLRYHADVSEKRKTPYAMLRPTSNDLCPKCFADGHFPEEFFAADFSKVESVQDYFPEAWTDQETLLLLEGLEKFGEDWEQVAEHVGTKNAEQCVTQFLRLPIEDPYLEDQITKMASTRLDPALIQRQDLPFCESANPIMSMVAFLASAVNPSVAASAAQATLASLLKSPKSSGQDSNSQETPFLDVKTASVNGLQSAANRAKQIAEQEEKEIQNLMAGVIEAQIKKIEIKLKYFEDMEENLERERAQIERSRQQLYHEKVQFNQSKLSR
eukprot:TRINITY_DN1152_c0_g1_i2.p1 TRINITY_DN1152_c0_g1~~TRINITY_DN1152_c0_g1_i2.p1  ORF type:complete len:489 (-),score=90.79 TRINITY_DN1152_c0_g1_i2:88-1554(-)